MAANHGWIHGNACRHKRKRVAQAVNKASSAQPCCHKVKRSRTLKVHFERPTLTLTLLRALHRILFEQPEVLLYKEMQEVFVNNQPHRVVISLGSNMGDTKDHLRCALEAVCACKGVSLLAASSIYVTEPQGVKDQPWFANQVAILQCSPEWTPWFFLNVLLEVETSLGRVRTRRWGPRIIDLDLLLFGTQTNKDPWLTLPHPRMHKRAFVLVPLLEIEPELRLPDGNKAAQFLDSIPHTVEHAIIRQS